ncbi:MAG TPA: hypothetical protein VJ144_06210, partial [Candidatus Polarisedimenticolia bacterium]|nr:hypothetical protein [Candidatus Polarisedimenticolia bacterium]
MMSRGVIFDLDGTLLDKAAGMTCVGVTTSYEFEESGGVETNGSTPPRAFALPPRRSLANESLAARGRRKPRPISRWRTST